MPYITFIFLFFALTSPVLGDTAMDQSTMESIFKDNVEQANGQSGFIEAQFQQLPVYLISDPQHDRMRIITPITEFKNINAEQIWHTLESNFHQALDARYAISNGVLYAAYIHPISPLTEAQIISAVQQVTNLALSFGTEYSSGVLSFGAKKH